MGVQQLEGAEGAVVESLEELEDVEQEAGPLLTGDQKK